MYIVRRQRETEIEKYPAYSILSCISGRGLDH